MSTLDRLPPHSLEAEQGVLGCILWDPLPSLDVCQSRLRGGDWAYDLRHQAIYRAVVQLHAAMRPVELIGLQEALKTTGELEQIGGIAYLSGLQDKVPSAANLEYYLDIVLAKWRARVGIRLATHLVARLYEGDLEPERAIVEAVGELEVVTTPEEGQRERHIRQILPGVIEKLERYHRGQTQMHGLPTGLEYLDKHIQGIAPTDYVVIAARPGDGKTSLAMNIVDHLTTKYEHWEPTGEQREDGSPVMRCQRGIPVGVFSLEMDGESLVQRMMFGHADADMGRWNTGMATAEDVKKLTVAAGALNQAPIYIDDLGDQTIGKIRSRARRMAKEHGIKLFVLDYIQLLDTDDEKLRNDRVRELAKISKAIVSLKKQLKIPWLVLAQMNRNIETAERGQKRVPVLSDLKDSGSLEQDADVVLFLYRPNPQSREEDQALLDEVFGDDWTRKPALVNAHVAKHRDGPTGQAELLFWKNMTRFEDLRKWKVANGHTQAAKGEAYRAAEPEELPSNEEIGL